MTDPLLLLSDSDLAEIVRALRSRRLVPPFTGVAFQRLLPETAAAEVAESLRKLAGQGFTADQMATVAEMIAQSRLQRHVAETLFDLVVTGPEAPGVTNRDTSVVVREMFAHAEQSVIVAGYAVHQGQKVFDMPDWLKPLPHLDQLLAVWEWRMQPTPWLVMTPKRPA